MQVLGQGQMVLVRMMQEQGLKELPTYQVLGGPG